MKDGSKKVMAVTIAFNPEINRLEAQIKSLFGQVTEMVIVDNASKNHDEIVKCLDQLRQELGSPINLIENERNMGLGFAQNQGIKNATEKEATHVLILDQDSVLDDGFVENLLKSEAELESKGIRVGAVGPVYYNEKTKELYPITKYKGPFIERIKPTEQPVQASFLIASGCLIKIAVLNEVGLMNEELFIDYIDVDWSYRAVAKGYSVFASPSAKMEHAIGDSRASILGRSISVHGPLRRYYLYRNSFYMIRQRHIPLGYKLREITFNGLRFIVFLFLSKDRMKYCRYSIAGFFDGIKGVKGECPHK